MRVRAKARSRSRWMFDDRAGCLTVAATRLPAHPKLSLERVVVMLVCWIVCVSVFVCMCLSVCACVCWWRRALVALHPALRPRPSIALHRAFRPPAMQCVASCVSASGHALRCSVRFGHRPCNALQRAFRPPAKHCAALRVVVVALCVVVVASCVPAPRPSIA